jgi:hypothetical protein
LAPSASSRRCSKIAAMEGEADGRWTRSIPPLRSRPMNLPRWRTCIAY